MYVKILFYDINNKAITPCRGGGKTTGSYLLRYLLIYLSKYREEKEKKK